MVSHVAAPFAALCALRASSQSRPSLHHTNHALPPPHRYLPPLRAVLLTFDPLPTFAHPTASFPASASPFPRRRHRNGALESDDEDSEEEEEGAEGKEVKKVQFKVIPLIEGSGFGLANVEFKGMAWRPRVGQKIGTSLRFVLLFAFILVVIEC